MELKIRVPNDSETRNAMRRYDTQPQYEVWKYGSLNRQDFTYFLFGNVDGTGPFQLVSGVYDLIPDEAKTRVSAQANPGNVPMSHYLTLFYYQDLSAVGGHFGRRFSELDQLWNWYTSTSLGARERPAPPEGELEAHQDRYVLRDRHDPITPPEAPVLSDYEGTSRDELVVQTVRTLSDDDEPRLVLMALSSPRLWVGSRSVRDRRIDLPGYWMRHTLIVRDETLTEVGRLTERVTSARGDVSTFVLRHIPRPLHLTITAETLKEDAVAPETGPPFPGQAHITPRAPLSTDPEVFEMSDLVTGTMPSESLDLSSLPFPLLPTRRLWRRDPLRLYLELYHLETERGVGQIRADFRVLPLDDDGEIDVSRDPVTLSVDLESNGSTYREAFDMTLRDQEEGRYRVEVEVTDLLAGETLRRTAEIELLN